MLNELPVGSLDNMPKASVIEHTEQTLRDNDVDVLYHPAAQGTKRTPKTSATALASLLSSTLESLAYSKTPQSEIPVKYSRVAPDQRVLTSPSQLCDSTSCSPVQLNQDSYLYESTSAASSLQSSAFSHDYDDADDDQQHHCSLSNHDIGTGGVYQEPDHTLPNKQLHQNSCIASFDTPEKHSLELLQTLVLSPRRNTSSRTARMPPASPSFSAIVCHVPQTSCVVPVQQMTSTAMLSSEAKSADAESFYAFSEAKLQEKYQQTHLLSEQCVSPTVLPVVKSMRTQRIGNPVIVPVEQINLWSAAKTLTAEVLNANQPSQHFRQLPPLPNSQSPLPTHSLLTSSVYLQEHPGVVIAPPVSAQSAVFPECTLLSPPLNHEIHIEYLDQQQHPDKDCSSYEEGTTRRGNAPSRRRLRTKQRRDHQRMSPLTCAARVAEELPDGAYEYPKLQFSSVKGEYRVRFILDGKRRERSFSTKVRGNGYAQAAAASLLEFIEARCAKTAAATTKTTSTTNRNAHSNVASLHDNATGKGAVSKNASAQITEISRCVGTDLPPVAARAGKRTRKPVKRYTAYYESCKSLAPVCKSAAPVSTRHQPASEHAIQSEKTTALDSIPSNTTTLHKAPEAFQTIDQSETTLSDTRAPVIVPSSWPMLGRTSNENWDTTKSGNQLRQYKLLQPRVCAAHMVLKKTLQTANSNGNEYNAVERQLDLDKVNTIVTSNVENLLLPEATAVAKQPSPASFDKVRAVPSKKLAVPPATKKKTGRKRKEKNVRSAVTLGELLPLPPDPSVTSSLSFGANHRLVDYSIAATPKNSTATTTELPTALMLKTLPASQPELLTQIDTGAVYGKPNNQNGSTSLVKRSPCVSRLHTTDDVEDCLEQLESVLGLLKKFTSELSDEEAPLASEASEEKKSPQRQSSWGRPGKRGASKQWLSPNAKGLRAATKDSGTLSAKDSYSPFERHPELKSHPPSDGYCRQGPGLSASDVYNLRKASASIVRNTPLSKRQGSSKAAAGRPRIAFQSESPAWIVSTPYMDWIRRRLAVTQYSIPITDLSPETLSETFFSGLLYMLESERYTHLTSMYLEEEGGWSAFQEPPK